MWFAGTRMNFPICGYFRRKGFRGNCETSIAARSTLPTSSTLLSIYRYGMMLKSAFRSISLNEDEGNAIESKAIVTRGRNNDFFRNATNMYITQQLTLGTPA
jgi:hypothetical protein